MPGTRAAPELWGLEARWCLVPGLLWRHGACWACWFLVAGLLWGCGACWAQLVPVAGCSGGVGPDQTQYRGALGAQGLTGPCTRAPLTLWGLETQRCLVRGLLWGRGACRAKSVPVLRCSGSAGPDWAQYRGCGAWRPNGAGYRGCSGAVGSAGPDRALYRSCGAGWARVVARPSPAAAAPEPSAPRDSGPGLIPRPLPALPRPGPAAPGR